jgi:hypothetical protein
VLLKKLQTTTVLLTLVVSLRLPLFFGCTKQDVAVPSLSLVASQSSASLPAYDIFELTLKHNGDYANKFFDPTVAAIFTGPSGKQLRVGGFYYGGDLWKVRFRPNEAGRWTYEYTMSAQNGFRGRGTGQFEATASHTSGPVIRNPNNRYRWMFANGKPYFPLGLQECIGVQGSHVGGESIDGGTRSEGGRKVSMDEYFTLYGAAGFNLFRFSQKNCSYPLFDDLDHYREAEAQATDELLSLARAHAFRVMFGFFGSYGSSSSSSIVRAVSRRLHLVKEGMFAPHDQDTIAKEKRFIDYCIARWGVYADFWEMLNEREASDEWTSMMADYVHTHDPDHKPVATSWEKPMLPAIDINAPHWYESEDELKSDLRVQELASKWKQAGKPVIVGEQGNSGMNWEPASAVRMRIRSWTALFEEITLVYWETGWSKWGMHQGRYTPGDASNIYIGPEERGYMRVLSDFAARLEPDVQIVPVQVNSPDVRAYGLRSQHGAAAYLVHTTDHHSPANHLGVTLLLPQNGRQWIAEWIDPATGTKLKTQEVPADGIAEAPPFQVDLALLVSPR